MNNTMGGSSPAGYKGTGYGYAQNRQEINLPFEPATNPVVQQPTGPSAEGPQPVSLKDQAPGAQTPGPVTYPGAWKSSPWWQHLGHPIWHGQAPVPIGILGIHWHPMTGVFYG